MWWRAVYLPWPELQAVEPTGTSSESSCGRGRCVRECSSVHCTQCTDFFVPVTILRLDCFVYLFGGGVEPSAPRLRVQGLLKFLAYLGGGYSRLARDGGAQTGVTHLLA